MKLHIKTAIWSFGVFLCSTVVSFALCANETTLAKWVNNILIGLIASSALLLLSSLIGYLHEEQTKYHEYYWNLIQLKNKALVSSTIPSDSDLEYKWQAIADVNSLLEGYFAVCDQGYVFPKRKKIQKML